MKSNGWDMKMNILEAQIFKYSEALILKNDEAKDAA
jgi:hypothetical protein